MGKKSFYEISPSEGYLREGSYLEVSRQINYHGERADFMSRQIGRSIDLNIETEKRKSRTAERRPVR